MEKPEAKVAVLKVVEYTLGRGEQREEVEYCFGIDALFWYLHIF